MKISFPKIGRKWNKNCIKAGIWVIHLKSTLWFMNLKFESKFLYIAIPDLWMAYVLNICKLVVFKLGCTF